MECGTDDGVLMIHNTLRRPLSRTRERQFNSIHEIYKETKKTYRSPHKVSLTVVVPDLVRITITRLMAVLTSVVIARRTAVTVDVPPKVPPCLGISIIVRLFGISIVVGTIHAAIGRRRILCRNASVQSGQQQDACSNSSRCRHCLCRNLVRLFVCVWKGPIYSIIIFTSFFLCLKEVLLAVESDWFAGDGPIAVILSMYAMVPWLGLN